MDRIKRVTTSTIKLLRATQVGYNLTRMRRLAGVAP
jgi:hypothetical protein